MAKIEMDVSEWETMKKHEKALETALEKEGKLLEEIVKLKQDKIDVLEKASKSVAIIKTTNKHETLLIKKSFQQVIASIKTFLSLRHIPSRFEDNSDFNYSFEELKKTFFDVTTIRNQEVSDEIIYKGFDEVKADLRKELNNELSKSVKDKLEKYKELTKQLDGLNDYIKRAEKAETELLKLEKENSKLKDKNKEYNEKWDVLSEYIGNMSTNFLSARQEIIDLKTKIKV